MLTLYHSPTSPNSRRVWIVLLEKAIPFELVSINLAGEQFQPEFLALNPFHHVPVLVDDGFTVVESLAILDYLEARYSTPALLPSNPKALAIVRMVELVTLNELLPALRPLLPQWIGLSEAANPQKVEQAKLQAGKVLTLFEQLLGEHSYFGGNHLTLAEAVAGTVVPSLPAMGMPLHPYPKLQAWCERLMERPSWQTTQPTTEAMEAVRSRLKAQMAQQQTQ